METLECKRTIDSEQRKTATDCNKLLNNVQKSDLCEGCSMGAGLGGGIAMAELRVCGGNEKYVQAGNKVA